MIVGGQTEARAQLSSTIIDYHEPFDQGLMGLLPLYSMNVLHEVLTQINRCPVTEPTPRSLDVRFDRF